MYIESNDPEKEICLVVLYVVVVYWCTRMYQYLVLMELDLGLNVHISRCA